MSNKYTSVIYLSSGNDYLNSSPASSIVPLQLKDINDDNIVFNQTRTTFKDGYSVYQSEMLKNAKDVKYNHDSLIWLTSSFDQNEFLTKNASLTLPVDYLDKLGFLYTKIAIKVRTSTNPSYISNINNTLALADSIDNVTLFKLTKTESNTLKISDNNSYLTINKNNLEITFELESADENKTQEFNYKIDRNSIYFYFQHELGEKFIGIKNDLSFYANGINSSRYDNVSILTNNRVYKEKNCEFMLINSLYSTYQLGNLYEKNTSWVHYYKELADKENLLNVEINEPKSFHRVRVNNLIISPYESTIDIASESININHLPLKNMMTPEQNYTIEPKRREYNKIFTGDKDDTGYEKTILSYEADTKLQILDVNKDTYFHYPFEAPQIALSASGLIESGALAGSTPFNSDKIFKKNAKYEDFMYWGESKQIFGCDDGVWLCAWLSGSNGSSFEGLDKSIWVDRWYDPSKLTEETALSLGYNTFNLEIKTPVFFDVPSELTFDPGVYYYYHRTGNDDIKVITDTFNLGNTALRLQFKDNWGTDTEDLSPYANTGKIDNFNSEDIIDVGPAYGSLNQKSILLSDDNYISVPQSDSLDLSGSFTLATWIYSNNWKNNPGSDIISTNFRSGAKINYSNNFFTPIVGIIEDTYAHVVQHTQCNPNSDTKITYIQDDLTTREFGIRTPFDWTWFGTSTEGANPITWQQLLDIDPDNRYTFAYSTTATTL
jgi:hypothetical protein